MWPFGWIIAAVVVVLAIFVGIRTIGAGLGHANSNATATSTQPGLVVSGSTLAATLVDVPKGAGVYLVGVSGSNALDPGARLLVLQPCRVAGTVATCTFPAPSWSGTVTYTGYSTSGRMSSPVTVSPNGKVTGNALDFNTPPAAGASGPSPDLQLALSSPVGFVPPGTPLLATVMGLPPGDSAFLVGSASDATHGGTSILVLAPCTGSAAAGTQATCSFKSPAFSGNVDYGIHLVGTADLAMNVAVDPPLDQMPEVPLAVALPALMAVLIGAQIWRVRHRGALR